MMNTQQAGDARAQLETRLAYLHNVLRWIDVWSQEKTAITQRYRPLAPLKDKWRLLPFALWAAGLLLVLTVIGTPIIQAQAKAAAYAEGSIRYPNIQMLNVAILMIPVALVLALAVLLMRNKLILPLLHGRAERINKKRAAHNEPVRAEEQIVLAKLNQASRDIAAHIRDFPQAYMYDEAVGFCVQMVRNHRATSISEALNLFETERHRQRMENMQAWQLAEAQRTRKLVAVGNVVNAALTGAAIGSIRQEGARTRATNTANHAATRSHITKEFNKRW
ncbi:hypothetical protein E3T39_06630 [Cryobacterium suzukii]|uniref:Uncharacterized protein n=1 Tax=Cryobacterium suzukii TaxID=1259198 RepID=A0A4R9AHM0_9MICO|nr:hypothetical protein [Cryobacterium suzukii]TFD61703.1 hypothetical protein E3T39_06630 [Cryobacterium suzukii]